MIIKQTKLFSLSKNEHQCRLSVSEGRRAMPYSIRVDKFDATRLMELSDEEFNRAAMYEFGLGTITDKE